jgi:lipopolysaccharide export system protein LptA
VKFLVVLNPSFIWICGFLLSCFFGLPVYAEEIKVKYKADKIEYINNQKTFRLLGHVEMVVRDMVITSEKLEYDTENKVLFSEVPFEIVQTTKENQKRTIKGDKLVYDIRLKRAEAENVYLIVPAQSPGQEVYIQGEKMTAYDDGKRVVFLNGFYTTCNHFDKSHQLTEGQVDPHNIQDMRKQWTHYAIDSEVLDYVEGKRILAWNARIMAFEGQAFWFPFWYIPLENPQGINKPDIDAGQNPVEGVFTKFKGYYHWNDFHDGFWYLTAMEKKGVGLGFQHDWVAAPNSITRFYFYGLPVTNSLVDLPGYVTALFTPPNDQALTQGTATTQQATTEPNFFQQLANWRRNKFQDYEINIAHKQRLLPYTEADLKYTNKDFYNTSAFQAQRNPTQNFSLDITDSQLVLLDSQTELKVDTRLHLDQSLSGPLNVTFPNGEGDTSKRQEESQNVSGQNRSGNLSLALGETSLNLDTQWRESSSSTKTKTFENTVLKSENEGPFSSSDNLSSTLNLNVPINEKLKLTGTFNYQSNINGMSTTTPQGTLIQTLNPRVSLAQTLDWGSLNLSYEDYFTLSQDRQAAQNQSSGQIKKLPELQVQLNPFFQETFPIQLETRLGRYFDPSTTALTLSQFNLNEIGRTLLRVSLGAKELDLGMGMKANFGGTSFEQRLYQTQDAEYNFTGRVTLRNDLSPYFIPSVTYERSVQDLENNNSPFALFEPLTLQNFNNLNASLALVNLPEFTWTLNGGYNFLSRSYPLIRSDISSQLGNQFVLRSNFSYEPTLIRESDVGTPLKDINNQPYLHNGSTITVKPEDVGSFSPYGGRWGNLSIGMRWRSNEQIFATGDLSTFGLESGIPEGVELGGDIGYDFHLGRLNALNGVFKFSFGDSWLWHTELDLTFSVQPTTLQTTEELALLVIPFKLTLRKDLHDFILTASWDSFYQQFNLNLSLLAFPFSTSDISGNLNKINQQAGQQINTLGQGF